MLRAPSTLASNADTSHPPAPCDLICTSLTSTVRLGRRENAGFGRSASEWITLDIKAGGATLMKFDGIEGKVNFHSLAVVQDGAFSQLVAGSVIDDCGVATPSSSTAHFLSRRDRPKWRTGLRSWTIDYNPGHSDLEGNGSSRTLVGSNHIRDGE